MCGIFGYCNYSVAVPRRKILTTLVNGLRRLEYRGYDSAGLAVDGDSPTHPVVVRAVGTVDSLARAVDELTAGDDAALGGNPVLTSHVGIAHTRWATHGAPSVINSHPHASDPDNQFLVVHNGIITNFKPLKSMLTGKGAAFESDTDTEVIAKLAKYLYETVVSRDGGRLSFPRLVMHLMHELEGAFALLVRSTHFPNQVIACKRGSPLVVGLKPVSTATKIQVFQSSMLVPEHSPTAGAGGGNGAAPFKRRRIDRIDTNNPRDSDSPIIGGRAPSGVGGGVPLSRADSGPHASPPHHVFTEDEAEFFFSSDASALVEHTDKVLYLEDGDVVHVDNVGHMDLYNFRNSETEAHISSNRVVNTLKMELEQIMKGEYPHFMLKEIFEQTETITQTMRGRILAVTRGAAGMADVQLGGLHNRVSDIRRSTRMIFVACGTSYHSCLAARQVLEELAELPVSVELASDFLDRQTPIFRSDVCVFVSQSGETADTLEALQYVKTHQALTLGIVNTVGSSISRLTDCGVHLNAGAEIGVASTKVYTSQITVMVCMALFLSSDSRAKQDRRKEIFQGLVDLPDKVGECLQGLDAQMKALAERLKGSQSILLFGRGYQYATCLEAALKVKEVSYVHTEGIHAGELKHGPLALVDEDMPVILFANKDSTAPKVHNALNQVIARGGMSNMVIVCTEGDEDMACFADRAELVQVPATVDCLQCILSIIPMQLFSYHLAVARGHNVDNPRNLAKSVTVS
jgi:glutamine---fructose-6-phosphate transaminase (isomerizing)